MEPNNTQQKFVFWYLISHCAFRIDQREHHVSDYLLAGIEGCRTKTKLASSLLIMTIVGGAIAPVIMGYIADTTGSMAIAFLIPLVCYGVIGGYAAMPRCSSTGVERD